MQAMIVKAAEKHHGIIESLQRRSFGRPGHVGAFYPNNGFVDNNHHQLVNYALCTRSMSFNSSSRMLTSRSIDSQKRYQSTSKPSPPSPFATDVTRKPKSPFDAKAAAVAAGDAASTTTTTRPKPRKRRELKFVPRKAAVQMTDKARKFFRALLDVSKPDIVGIMLKYDQSSTGEPRMVFSFDFVRAEDITPEDEGVSLEVNEDGTPKSPTDTLNDGLKKLYIHHGAFLKALGSTVDVDTNNIVPILYDREGNRMDPNA